MDWRTLTGTLTLLLMLVPVGAGAKLCGDDVDGQAVGCECGDVVVSDLTLSDNHPVVQTACENNGLVVQASSAKSGVTIDLHGYTLQGKGRGFGIFVLSGGQGGAHIVSSSGPGTVAGFLDGISSRGTQTSLIDGLLLVRNQRDAISIEGNAYEIRNTEARDSGRDAFSVTGKAYGLRATRAVNSKRFGYFVRGENGALGTAGAGPTSDGSGQAGFSITGPGHHLIDCVVTRSSKTGVMLHGSHYEIRGCTVTKSGEDGINGIGADWKVAGNLASNNANNGLIVSGPGVTDLGGNGGTANRGERTHEPAAQCEINHHPCEP